MMSTPDSAGFPARGEEDMRRTPEVKSSEKGCLKPVLKLYSRKVIRNTTVQARIQYVDRILRQMGMKPRKFYLRVYSNERWARK